MDNPLLTFTDLPPFSLIHPEHIEPAIDTLLQQNRDQLETLLAAAQPPTWENLVIPLTLQEDRLDQAWSPISHLNSVMNGEALRAAHNRCLPKLAAYGAELGQHRPLFLAYQQLASQSGPLNAVQRRVLELELRDFRLSGIDLPPAQRERYKDIAQRLAELTSRFSENLLDATQGWSRTFDDLEPLAGIPESALALARDNALRAGETGWRFNLEYPSYQPIITHAQDRELRREFYTAFVTRASDQGPQAGRWDNSAIMEEILALRHEEAQLIGFSHYADYSLATKMAPSSVQVIEFLKDLAERSHPQGLREFAQLQDFAANQLGIAHLEAWDLAYATEQLRQHRYAISDEELRPYFPHTRVLQGLFAVVERLFGIRVTEQPAPDLWHPDVRFFAVQDADDRLLGHFFLDLFSRPNKRGGAWMDNARSRFFRREHLQTPVAYLICNFSPPLTDRPSLLTRDEVMTLFHEFGHGLHHLLTTIDHPSVAGIHGVAWDAVELPSQFLENWFWEPEALALIAGHWQTGEALPDPLFQRMHNARYFQSAMQMLRQLEFSLFDFKLHLDYNPAHPQPILEVLKSVRQSLAVVPYPDFNRMPHSFSHIFSGGYAAGYYSYKWAEVLSADAFSLFEEQGIFNSETGRAFLKHILQPGGSRDALELFIEFRGRAPSILPLLRHHGIIDQPSKP